MMVVRPDKGSDLITIGFFQFGNQIENAIVGNQVVPAIECITSVDKFQGHIHIFLNLLERLLSGNSGVEIIIYQRIVRTRVWRGNSVAG